jgi:hypothetical protein
MEQLSDDATTIKLLLLLEVLPNLSQYQSSSPKTLNHMNANPRSLAVVSILVAAICIGVWFRLGQRNEVTPESSVTHSAPKVHTSNDAPRQAGSALPDSADSPTPTVAGELGDPPPKRITRSDSISYEADGPLVAEAQEILKLNPGPERTAKWQELLAKADYNTLLRMTEVAAKPVLNEDRKALRAAAIHQIGTAGELSRFIDQRAGFDKGGFSLTQVAAWEEWGRSAPAEAIPAWLERAANRHQPGDWAIKAFSRSLLNADPKGVVASLEKLDAETQAYFFLNLGKSLQASDPATAQAWLQMIKDPEVLRALMPESPAQ